MNKEEIQDLLFKRLEEIYVVSKNEYPGNIFILCNDKDIVKENFRDIYFDIKLNDDGSDFNVISTDSTINEYKRAFVRNGIHNEEVMHFQKEAERAFKNKIIPIFDEINHSQKFNINLKELAKKDLLEYQKKEIASIQELKDVMKKIGYKDMVDFEYNGYNTLKVDDGDLEVFIINDSEEKIDILAIKEYTRDEALDIFDEHWLSSEEVNIYESNLIQKYKNFLKNEPEKNKSNMSNISDKNELELLKNRKEFILNEKVKQSNIPKIYNIFDSLKNKHSNEIKYYRLMDNMQLKNDTYLQEGDYLVFDQSKLKDIFSFVRDISEMPSNEKVLNMKNLIKTGKAIELTKRDFKIISNIEMSIKEKILLNKDLLEIEKESLQTNEKGGIVAKIKQLQEEQSKNTTKKETEKIKLVEKTRQY